MSAKLCSKSTSPLLSAAAAAEQSTSQAPTEPADYNLEERKESPPVKQEAAAEATPKRRADEDFVVTPTPCKMSKIEEKDEAADDDDTTEADEEEEEHEHHHEDCLHDDEADVCCDECTFEEDEQGRAPAPDPAVPLQCALAYPTLREPFEGDPTHPSHRVDVLRQRDGTCPVLPSQRDPARQLQFIEGLLWRAYTLHLAQVAVPDRVHPAVIRALQAAGFTLFRATYTREGQVNSCAELNVTFYGPTLTHQDVVSHRRASGWRGLVENPTSAFLVCASDL